jgi:Ca-activated chloride channel family protein
LRSIQFASPWVLALLIVLPIWWLVRRKRRPAAIVFSRVGVLAAGPRAGRSVTFFLFALRNLLLASTIVALSRPRAGAHAEDVTSEGINIVLAIDLSSSMLAQDFQPQNRMEVAKEMVKLFILQRKADRIGIVAFAAEALTQVPLTTDYPVVLAAVDNLAAGQLEDGTAIGTAIVTAANRLRDAPGRSRVMVLLTDGENNRGAVDPRTAAKAAAAFNIRIYTIGVGTVGMAPVPVGMGVFGLRFENRPVKIDEPLLTEVSATTGGRDFRAQDAQALERILQQINTLEREPVQTRSYVRYTELFRWPLTVAILALAAELLLTAWRGPLP